MSKYFDSRNEADRTLCNKIIDLYEDCEFNEEEIEEFPHKYYKYLRAIYDLCPYWERYYELSLSNTDDLLLYAMMYRNVMISERWNNIFDKHFFVQRREQIIGYKKQIFESNNKTCKMQVLQLYYEYGSSFEDFCRSVLGKTISIHNTTEFIWNGQRAFVLKDLLHLDNLLSGRLDKVYSINDFSESECSKLLEHKNELLSAYKRKSYIYRVGVKTIRTRYEGEIDLSTARLKNIVRGRHASLIHNWVISLRPILVREEEKELKRQEEEERKRREGEEKRLEQYRFNMRNKHWRDDSISFRKADHQYIVDGTPLDSVTTFVKNCFPEFNADFHAKRKAESLGITKEEVLEMWDKKGRESREQGTAMHEKIESYYLGKSVSTDSTFELFKIFANKITLKPYRTEWAVYDWDQKIAGTIDFVDYQNGEYIIYDWKRSDKLIAKNGLPIKNSQYGEKALPPIENLDDSPYYHYALQLSLYKYILEKNYGITVSKLRLGIFHPSYNKPYVLEMPYLKNEIDTLFELRSEVIF